MLDPFSGSGTTGIVAVKNGRSHIGIELNAEYVEITKQRVKKEVGIEVSTTVDGKTQTMNQPERATLWQRDDIATTEEQCRSRKRDEFGLGRVHTTRSASTMRANERKPRKRTSSFSKREKMRRNPLSLRNRRSISLRFL